MAAFSFACRPFDPPFSDPAALTFSLRRKPRTSENGCFQKGESQSGQLFIWSLPQ
jgi:hypothetical protein